MQLITVEIIKPDDANVIIGQAHFIKTVEDVYEALVQAVPGIKFGLSFCEASGPCLIRHSGTDAELEKMAIEAAAAIGNVFCATANSVRLIVAEDGGGRGVIGVIDGNSPKGVESAEDQAERRAMLRRFGYKQ